MYMQWPLIPLYTNNEKKKEFKEALKYWWHAIPSCPNNDTNHLENKSNQSISCSANSYSLFSLDKLLTYWFFKIDNLIFPKEKILRRYS